MRSQRQMTSAQRAFSNQFFENINKVRRIFTATSLWGPMITCESLFRNPPRQLTYSWNFFVRLTMIRKCWKNLCLYFSDQNNIYKKIYKIGVTILYRCHHQFSNSWMKKSKPNQHSVVTLTWKFGYYWPLTSYLQKIKSSRHHTCNHFLILKVWRLNYSNFWYWSYLL